VPLTRWNDDRLDDLARRVNETSEALRQLQDLRVSQSVLEAKVDDVAKDTVSCLMSLEQMKKDWMHRDEEARRERKLDRRWLIATALTVAAIIVASLGIFVG
jgi:hypothetical protein